MAQENKCKGHQTGPWEAGQSFPENSSADLSPLWLFRTSSVSEWDQALSMLATCPTHLNQLPSEVEGRGRRRESWGKMLQTEAYVQSQGKVNYHALCIFAYGRGRMNEACAAQGGRADLTGSHVKRKCELETFS